MTCDDCEECPHLRISVEYSGSELKAKYCNDCGREFLSWDDSKLDDFRREE